MQSIIIVVESPAIARKIGPVAREHWPADSITILCCTPYKNIRFEYPRGLRWGEYPHLSLPKYKLADLPTWQAETVEADGSLTPTSVSEATFRGADQIVFANNPDHAGATAFQVMTDVLLGTDGKQRSFPAIIIRDMTDESLRQAFADQREFSTEFHHQIEYGRAKRYFDWNWNINGLAILGSVTRGLGVDSKAPPLSKYSLQLLYDMNMYECGLGRGKRVLNAVVAQMHGWQGTGKYANNDERISLGSPTSFSSIIENLVAAGYLSRHEQGKVAILEVSELGFALLWKLHKDCCDLDLPFRLDHWCSEGFEASKPAMDHYLNSFFGKVKRAL